MNSLYYEELTNYVNSFTTCYLELAPKNATFPYVVLIPPTTTDLSFGDLLNLDFEIYSNELNGFEKVEEISSLLREKLDKYSLNLADKFTSHISFDGYFNLREREQDILARRVTFTARIFYKKERKII